MKIKELLKTSSEHKIRTFIRCNMLWMFLAMLVALHFTSDSRSVVVLNQSSFELASLFYQVNQLHHLLQTHECIQIIHLRNDESSQEINGWYIHVCRQRRILVLKRALMILNGLYCFQRLKIFTKTFIREYFRLQDRIKH